MLEESAPSLLREIVRLQAAIDAAVVLGPEGEVLAMATRDGLSHELVPVLTLLVTTSERAARELGRGGLLSVLVEATQGHLVLLELGGGRSLGVIASPGASPGLLLDDAHSVAERLAERVS